MNRYRAIDKYYVTPRVQKCIDTNKKQDESIRKERSNKTSKKSLQQCSNTKYEK